MVFNIIEGDVQLVDKDGNSLATVSGANGPMLEVSTSISVDATISGIEGEVKVREQNLDDTGYIRNSAHNYGQYDGNWMPFALDAEGRQKIVYEVFPTTHTISGSAHTGQLDDSQIPSYITRDEELITVSGSLQQQIDFKSDIGHAHIESDIVDLDKYTQNEVDVLITTVSGAIIKDHGNLTGLSDDDHTQYLNTARHSSTALHGSSVVDHNSIGGLQGGASNQRYHLNDAQYTNISGGNPTFNSVTATHYGDGSHLTGISGAGGAINIQDDYVDVGSFDTLNFKYLTVTDEGGGVATITHEIVFGTYSAFGSSASESTTTSTTYQQKLRTTVSGLATGTYRLGWYCEYRCSIISDDVLIRIQQNDTTTLMETNIEIKDNSNYYPHSGFINVDLSAATTYNFDMDYRSEATSNTAYIRNTRFEFWRVI